MENTIKGKEDDTRIREVILMECLKPLIALNSKELKKEIRTRKKNISLQLKDINRIQYFRVFNELLAEAFYRVIQTKEISAKDSILLEYAGFGTEQWSDDSLNFMKSDEICSNMCLYCYIGGIFHHYGRIEMDKIVQKIEARGVGVVSHISSMTYDDRKPIRKNCIVDVEKIHAMNWGKQGSRKLFMSPTSHDLFPENIEMIIQKWKELLLAGHYLLIVSKPRMEVITRICMELQEFKDRIEFRFTMTSNENKILQMWEIFAPSFEDRLKCLKLVKKEGFRVSVSIEPYLSNPIPIVEQITEYCDEIWIGTMNSFPSEKIIGTPFCLELQTEITRLKMLYRLENIQILVEKMKTNPKIRWKESIFKAYRIRHHF